MVILIDTNILLDVLMKRSPFDKASALVWKICETRKAIGYISTLSYANIMYIMRKQLHESQIENIYEKMSLLFRFASFDDKVLKNAVHMKWKDFEDAIQSSTAESIHADYIVTRNTKDFTNSRIKAITPEEFNSIWW